MITLYGFARRFNVVDSSPFVVKVDLFLRLADIPFHAEHGVEYLKVAPKGKLPFIDDAGNKVADSAAILEYLTEKYQIPLDDELTAEQKAQTHFITKSLDEGLYWCLVHSRWALDESWPYIKDAFFGGLSAPISWIVPNIIRSKVKKNLHGQGVGRHSQSEILLMADKSLQALSTLLADNAYIFGDKPTSLDATIYAHLCQFISTRYDSGYESDLMKEAKSYPNLVDYCQRIENTYYQEN